jgi:hypothetical protein
MVGFGVPWVRGVLTTSVVLTLARVAAAQATASFPEPAGTAPAPVGNPTPHASPTPVTTQSVGGSTKPSLPAGPSAGIGVTPDRRYPTLPSTARTLPPANGPGAAFYPAILPYREGLPIPAGYRVEQRAANGLIVGGLVSLGVAYGVAIVVGASDSFKNGTSWLLLPVVGPWAAIGARSYHCTNDPLQAQQCIRGAFNEVQSIAILSADAVVQATGAVLFLAGLGSGQYELVRSEPEARIRLTPRAIGGGFGFGLDARF